MTSNLPSKSGKATFVTVEFTDAELHRLEAWIEALPEPRPDCEQAVRMLVRDCLNGSDGSRSK